MGEKERGYWLYRGRQSSKREWGRHGGRERKTERHRHTHAWEWVAYFRR